MKSIHFLFALALVAVGSVDAAFAGNRYCGTQLVCTGHYPLRSCRYVYSCGYDACSDEVKASNLAVVDQVLVEMAKRPEFANAAQFQEKIRSIQALATNEEKIAAYMGTMAIDPQNNEDLVNFIYGREVNQAQVDALQKSTGLSAAQAAEVAGKLAAALRGGQQK
ncbi:hypothetical protein K2X30_14400 [bacterium]|jgi:hypothetical protein|nr:hypothetical protein [bacterium]